MFLSRRWPDRRGCHRWSFLLLVALLTTGSGCGSKDEAGRQGSRVPSEQDIEQSVAQLKQMHFAVKSYHEVNKVYPAGGMDSTDGTVVHSWETQLLPYLDQQPLFNQIDQNQPWNAPANATAFQQTVPTFLQPVVTETHDPQGYALNHYAGNQQVLKPEGGFRIRNITDGHSYTILMGEISVGFRPWGQPGNIRDPAQGLSGQANNFGSHDPEGVLFLFADGRVKLIDKSIDVETLSNIANPADHNIIGDIKTVSYPRKSYWP